MLAGRAENDLQELVKEVLSSESRTHVEALRLLVRIHWWQRDMDNLRECLNDWPRPPKQQDLIEDERYALTQLVRLAPDEERFSARLDQLGGVTEDAESAALKLDAVSQEQSSSFESFAIVSDEVEAPAMSSDSPASEFEWNSVPEPAPAPVDASASFADLNESFEEAVDAKEEFEFGEVSIDDGSTSRIESAATADTSQREAMMRQELESVDFYISQGYADIAADTLDLLEKQFGANPEIEARRQTLQGASRRHQRLFHRTRLNSPWKNL